MECSCIIPRVEGYRRQGMAIQVKCGQCGKVLNVPDNSAGKQGRCTSCGAVIQIPAHKPPAPSSPSPKVVAQPVPEHIVVQCGQCGKMLRVPSRSAGKQGKCPSCGTLIQIPPVVETAEVEPVETTTPAQAEKKSIPPVRGGTRLIGFRKKPSETEERGTGGWDGRERRSGKDRRSGVDRRSGADRRTIGDRRGAGTRRGEFDPEKEAKKKKRMLILCAIVAVLLIATLIVYQVVVVGPVNKERKEFSLLIEAANSLLESYGNNIKKIKPLEMPDSPVAIDNISKSMKSSYEEFKNTLKGCSICPKVEKYRLFTILSEIPQQPDGMVKPVQKFAEDKKTAEEENWEPERLKKRKDDLHDTFLDAYHRMMVKYETARMYLAAIRYAAEGPQEMSEAGWKEWLQANYGRLSKEGE
jgi:ribosomal protein S27E